jgi:NAD(P)-dependent dehydrogenase (short-subunit alcohol dehydrogenase family)
MKLKNKTAMITGAAQGIGEEIAVTFAREGADLALVDVDEGKLAHVSEKITAMGRKVICARVDISNREDVFGFAARIKDNFGQLDILVNNAAYIKYDPFLEFKVEEWDRVMAVCLRGTFLCSQAAALEMVKQNSGAIINIASVAGLLGVPLGSAYCTAKGGIISFTKLLAIELAGYGIRANSISPGAVDTPSLRTIVGDDGIELRKQMVPLGRLGRIDDIAAAALFLASDAADFISGHNLIVDGAFMASP